MLTQATFSLTQPHTHTHTHWFSQCTHIIIQTITGISCLSPVSDHQLNTGFCRSLQGLVGLVCAPASTVLPIDLENLVPKAQASQGRGGVGLNQLDKQSLTEETRTRQ